MDVSNLTSQIMQISPLIVVILFLGVWTYFSDRKKQKQISELTIGDKVVVISLGVIGKVSSIGNNSISVVLNDKLTLEVLKKNIERHLES